jgi:putative membrane protein
MDFIDYVTLMLVNMTAGLVVLACFLWRDAAVPENRSRWASAFAAPGLVAVICGFVMTFSWPLPNPYNIMFGEMSVLLGVLFLGAAWSLAKGRDLTPLGLYALPAGAAAVLIGIRIIDLGLTANPPLSGAGFILTGLGGVFAPAALVFVRHLWLRRAGSLVLLAAASIWAWTGCLAYWMHLKPTG